MIYLTTITAIIVIMLIANGFAQAKTFNISRSILINRHAESVYPFIEDLRQWDNWSPWAEKDPAMEKQFSEPAKGVGASYSWNGNKQVGNGKMTITDSRLNESVFIRLDIETPFEAHNNVNFTLQPQESSTLATWSMSGSQNFFMRAMSLFFNMDKMVGQDFETGLRSLKALVED